MSIHTIEYSIKPIETGFMLDYYLMGEGRVIHAFPEYSDLLAFLKDNPPKVVEKSKVVIYSPVEND